MAADLGVMLNDTLGDCWTYNALGSKQMVTVPDKDVEDLYEQVCLYKPAKGGEGPGRNEQHVLTFILIRLGNPGMDRTFALAN